MVDGDVTVEDLFRALAVDRRRYALRSVQSHDVLALPDLAELVAEQEQQAAFTDIPAEDVRTIYLSLYHSHIPILQETNLVRYDQDRDLVTKTDHTRAYLKRINEVCRTMKRTLTTD